MRSLVGLSVSGAMPNENAEEDLRTYAASEGGSASLGNSLVQVFPTSCAALVRQHDAHGAYARDRAAALQSGLTARRAHMRCKWIVVAAAAALLTACAAPPERTAQREPWNGGVWNSVLGYVGPANVMVTN